MAWSEPIFRARITARAAELGISLRQALVDAGLGKDTIDKPPVTGRRIETLEKIAAALGWDLAEVMGYQSRISVELSAAAFASAERVLAHFPAAARTRDNLVQLHADLYDLAMARRREGRPLDANVWTAYEEMLVRAWEGKAGSPPAP